MRFTAELVFVNDLDAVSRAVVIVVRYNPAGHDRTANVLPMTSSDYIGDRPDEEEVKGDATGQEKNREKNKEKTPCVALARTLGNGFFIFGIFLNLDQ